MIVLTQTHADALRKVTTYLAEEHDDMQMFVERGGDPERHIAHYVTVLEGLLTDYTPDMTDSQLFKAAREMESCGGSFACAIAQAFFHADKENTVRLLTAFGDLFQKFNQGKSK